MTDDLVLAGDVGGTQTSLALLDAELRFVVRRRYASREHHGIEDLIRVFLSDCDERPRLAAFGLPGPVRGDRCVTTNLPWSVDVKDLRALGFERVILLNDLAAMALGALELAPEELSVIQAGSPDARGNRAIIAPGTGLGEAVLLSDGACFRALASEGGHADFAPRDELQWDLSRWLTGRHGHVSWERVVSGPGIESSYKFLRERRGLPPVASDAAAIHRAAMEGNDEEARLAFSIFVGALGAEAGNLVLRALATGGLYLGGGIVPRIQDLIAAPSFLEPFRDKGRFRRLVESVPVTLIVSDRAPLLGAARAALR